MKPIRKGITPVKIPFPIKSTDRVLASWCSEVRTALQQIVGRVPTVQGTRRQGGVSGGTFNVEFVGLSLIVEGGGGIGVQIIDSGEPVEAPTWYVRNGVIKLEDDAASVDVYQVITRLGNYGAVSGESGPGYTEAEEV